jgi:hypothetical protein
MACSTVKVTFLPLPLIIQYLRHSRQNASPCCLMLFFENYMKNIKTLCAQKTALKMLKLPIHVLTAVP